MPGLPRSLSAMTMAAALLVTAAPAVAQDRDPVPTVYSFSLPGSVTSGKAKFSLPGDLVTRKSRGGERLGKVPLADAIERLARAKANGRSVGGIVTIDGKTREMKGLPVVLDDGRVRIRVAQARGSRVMVIPRMGGTSQAASCPAGYFVLTIASTPPAQVCAPLPS